MKVVSVIEERKGKREKDSLSFEEWISSSREPVCDDDRRNLIAVTSAYKVIISEIYFALEKEDICYINFFLSLY